MSSLAIITGCNGGLGSALVRAFINVGYFVIGIDKSAEQSGFSGHFVVTTNAGSANYNNFNARTSDNIF